MMEGKYKRKLLSSSGLQAVLIIFTWVVVSTVSECPPPNSLFPCKCDKYQRINCDDITSSRELYEKLSQDFGTFRPFEEIQISHTPIDSIPSQVFHFVKAKNFRITNNKNLQYIGDDAFEGSADILERLYLNNNSISDDVVFDVVAKLSILKELDLSRNGLAKIPDYAFVKIKNALTINILYNELTSVGKWAFANLPHLEHVDLRHNKLTSIGEYAFYNLPRILEIILFENRLKTVGDFAFALGPHLHPPDDDSQLTVLWLNHNKLTGFWPKAFEGLSRNALIHMFVNNLTTFPQDVYTPILDQFHLLNSNNFFSKGFLDLGSNPWICDCRVKWLVDTPRYLRYAQGIVCESGKALLTYRPNDSIFKDCDVI